MTLSPIYSNAIVLSHYWKRHRSGIAPLEVTRDYLLPKVKNLITVEHPFPNSGFCESIVTWYENTKLKTTYTYKLPISGNYLPFLWHFLITIVVLIKFLFLKFDLVIAINNLLLFSAIWLKLLGKVNKMVYYTIDYLDSRFENKFINYTYHTLDKLACKYSDNTWVVVDRQIEIRKKIEIIGQNTNISVVPMAFDKSKFIETNISKIDIHKLVYVGTLLHKQGLQLVIESLVMLKKRFNKISLHIIGFGDYEKELICQVKKLKLSKFVKFYGYIGDKDEIDRILSNSSIGVATYVPESDNFTYLADPSKVKVYLSCGIPVIVTEVPAMAATISETGSGEVVEYTTRSITNGITKIIENNKTYSSYKRAAIKLGATFNKELILGKVIAEL